MASHPFLLRFCPWACGQSSRSCLDARTPVNLLHPLGGGHPGAPALHKACAQYTAGLYATGYSGFCPKCPSRGPDQGSTLEPGKNKVGTVDKANNKEVPST